MGNVEILGMPGVARQLPATATTANTALSTGCRRISMYVRGYAVRFAISGAATTANATTSHFADVGERLDFAVPPGANIAVIRDTGAAGDATVELTEYA